MPLYTRFGFFAYQLSILGVDRHEIDIKNIMKHYNASTNLKYLTINVVQMNAFLLYSEKSILWRLYKKKPLTPCLIKIIKDQVFF